MPKSKQVIFKCVMPEFMGYGIEAYGSTEQEAESLCKQKYHEMRRSAETSGCGIGEHIGTFPKAMSYFSGSVRRIELPCVGNEGENGEVVKSFDE